MIHPINTEDKKQYEKPAVIHTQVLESVAGACEIQDPVNGKTGSGTGCSTISS